MKKNFLIVGLLFISLFIIGCGTQNNNEVIKNEGLGIMFEIPNGYKDDTTLFPSDAITQYQLWDKKCLEDEACAGAGDASCFIDIYNAIYDTGKIMNKATASGFVTLIFGKIKTVGDYNIFVAGNAICEEVFNSIKAL